MIIDTLKELTTNIAVMLVFISAVEIISPDNKMKKYISFVLGIIFIAVLINPIVKILNSKDEGIAETISEFEMEAASFEKESNSQAVFNNDETSPLEKQFENNLNDKCKTILEEKFKDMEFKCVTDCTIRKDGMDYTINEVQVYIDSKKVEKVKAVTININDSDKEESEDYIEIKDYLKDALKIPKEKIKVYNMEN